MKLTQREMLLLKIMIVAAAVILSYYFVIMPQWEKIGDLKLQLADKEMEVQSVKVEIASLDRLEEEKDNLYIAIEEKTDKFYPKILQKKIIVLLDEIFSDTSVAADSIGFSQIDGGGTDLDMPSLQKMSVTFPYRGTYEQIMDLIIALEDMDRLIIINSLQMADGEQGILNGGMNVDFYAINKPRDQERDKDYIDWPYTGEYGKTNPFRIVTTRPIEVEGD